MHSESTKRLTEFSMNNGAKHQGVVVPMVTPITADGSLDTQAVDRLLEFLLASSIEGIFVLGTTGEGAAVPRCVRRQLVEHTVAKVRHRALVYAGVGDARDDAVADGNDHFRAGADVVVARPPVGLPVAELLPWFRQLLEGLNGPLILYNIPATTQVSIPLEVVGQLVGHPKLAGLKDSENDAKRLEVLLSRFGGVPNFSIFVGVGALMARGLQLGASGIVPSVGNLIPEVCQRLCSSARRSDWVEAEQQAARMKAVSALYQNGRTLGQSLAALKAAMSCRGLCAPHVLPPLHTLGPSEVEYLRGQMTRLELVG